MLRARFIALGVACSLGACGVSSSVSRRLGARCEDKSECDERCLVGEDYPAGFCTLSCQDSGDCPGGSACVEKEGGVCLFYCPGGDPDCEFLGEGWSCQALEVRSEDEEAMVCAGG